jgi:hypothetical protein
LNHPNGILGHSNVSNEEDKPKPELGKEARTVPTVEHKIEMIGPDGIAHEGNIEIRVSSSEQVIDPLPTSKMETIAKKVVETDKKHANVVTRSFWTFVMIGGFIGIPTPLVQFGKGLIIYRTTPHGPYLYDYSRINLSNSRVSGSYYAFHIISQGARNSSRERTSRSLEQNTELVFLCCH